MRRSNRGRSGSVGSDHHGNTCTKAPSFSDSNSSSHKAIEAATFLFQVALHLHSTEYELGTFDDDTWSNKPNFLHTLMRHYSSSRSPSLGQHEYICLIDSFLQRASYLDLCNGPDTNTTSQKTSATPLMIPPPSLLTQALLSRDRESGYSPLHEACFSKNLLAVLTMLRHAALRTLEPYPCSTHEIAALHQANLSFSRWPLIHPMKLLDPSPHSMTGNQTTLTRTNPSSVNLLLGPNPSADRLLWNMVTCKDHEGLTPLQLLSKCYISDFHNCRTSLSSRFKTDIPLPEDRTTTGLHEFYHHQISEEENTLAHHPQSETNDSSESPSHSEEYIYGCEIMTFGKADHCALGSDRDSMTSSTTFGLNPASVRPRRVEHFGLGTMGRDFSSKGKSGPAVAIAAATYHSLVVTSEGHLYAFGLGKGGRLGTGHESHSPFPVRILGALERRHVVAVSAAENHSLCVTSDGSVFAWGQNGFGQLGIPKTALANASLEQKFLPHRVEALRQSFIISVAAGDRHSMAQTKNGEVYTWGDNKHGQLGLGPLSETRNTVYLPSLVSTLSTNGKLAISIAASEFSSLVLTRTNTTGQETSALSKINSVFEFGHGNYVPRLVIFPSYDESVRPNRDIRRSFVTSMKTNPVAIACAKYHNVAITDDGRVYTWGLHSSELGNSTAVAPRPRQASVGSETDEWVESGPKVKTGSTIKRVASASGTLNVASPQLVQEMLPECGGGRAVQVSASETHTCVVTDCGTVFSWGSAYGNEVLGHQGVKYQPTPLKIPGVHRAVTLASAKEHTILLICTKFPPLSTPMNPIVTKLQDMACRNIAAHVDLFNVVPILQFAERIKSSYLINFCSKFIDCNLDGILSVGRKSEFESYLSEALSQSITLLDEHDDIIHPLLHSLVETRADSWVNDCQNRVKCLPVSILQKNQFSNSKYSDHCAVEASERVQKIVATLRCLDGCSNLESAQINLDSIFREIRTIKKKLGQVAELENILSKNYSLTPEQIEKINRRSYLEADLNLLEPIFFRLRSKVSLFKSLKDREDNTYPDTDSVNKSTGPIEYIKQNNKNVQTDVAGTVLVVKTEGGPASLKSCGSEENTLSTISVTATSSGNVDEQSSNTLAGQSSKYLCKVCSVSCPDEKSYELHINGRKHFNFLRHMREKNEQETVVKTTEAHVHKVSDNHLRATPSDKLSSPWGNASGVSVNPRYDLPQPREPTDQLSSVQSNFLTPKKSLRQIMDEEENKLRIQSANKKSSSAASVESMRPHPSILPRTSSTTTTIYKSTPLTNSNMSSNCRTASVWAKSIPTPESVNDQGRPVKKSSLYDIQQDEIHKKAVSDKGIIEGKWYVERRERALSISAIQQEEIEASTLQILIEEQRQIEEQIMKEKQAHSTKNVKKNISSGQKKKDTLKQKDR